ncbi:MAG: hypothetical protein WC728_15285 [Elusimicrobiota bacterium]
MIPLLRRSVAAVLAVSLALHPVLTHAANVAVSAPVAQPGLPAGLGHIAVGLQATPSLSLGASALDISLTPTFTTLPKLEAAPQAASPSLRLQALPAAAILRPNFGRSTVGAHSRSNRLGDDTPGTSGRTTTEDQEKPALGEKLQAISEGISDLQPALSDRGSETSKGTAESQISLLTGEKTASSVAVDISEPAPAGSQTMGRALPLAKAAPEAEVSGRSDPAAPKTLGEKVRSKFQVFKDPERNKAFWRYFLGENLYMIGFQMYMVAIPYFMKAVTKNTLQENGQLGQMTTEAFNALVRQNRSLQRIAHWSAQGLAYMAIPLFTQDGKVGPRKWLVRSALIRAAVIFGMPALFFASGLFSATGAVTLLLGLIAAQSFFQGLYVTMVSGSTARIMGDKSVEPAERMRANAILGFASSLIAIIAPAIAGRIAGIDMLFVKGGAGSAVIYFIYAAGVAAAGLVFSTIRLLGAPSAAPADAQASQGEKITGVGGALRNVLVSMKEGVKLILSNRFLRTLMLLSLVMSLFNDPLVFNVLPEFVEGLLSANPGAVSWLLDIPVLGWFMKGLVSTPMGFFAMLATFSSIGSAIAAALVNPVKDLLKKLGFQTEESLLLPFYALSALAVPAFWLLIHASSIWTVLLLYGLGSLVTGFAGTIVTGVYQKSLGQYTSKQMNQVLAANSFISIIAAITSTFVYGYVLTGIPIATSLLIAAVATTVLGALRLAAPFMFFPKEKLRRAATPPVSAP